jgi:beta-galactosidase/beta-glucuronidase
VAGPTHIGGFTSFEYDITPCLKAGDNLITVKCYDDIRRPCQAGGKQSDMFNSYGCYYTRTTGIWQTVWYESVPESYIKYARITPDANNATVSIAAELVGCGDVTAVAYYQGKKVGEACKRAVSVTANLEIELSETHLWELGEGRLYDLVLTFGEDEVNSYFGLRHIEMKDGKFYLNGKSVFQRVVFKVANGTVFIIACVFAE